jgi:hypothetical protein
MPKPSTKGALASSKSCCRVEATRCFAIYVRLLPELMPTNGRVKMVESRMGAVAWGHWPAPRFPSPLIEPDVRSYRIRLSDWLHGKAHSGADRGRRSRHSTPRVR